MNPTLTIPEEPAYVIVVSATPAVFAHGVELSDDEPLWARLEPRWRNLLADAVELDLAGQGSSEHKEHRRE